MMKKKSVKLLRDAGAFPLVQGPAAKIKTDDTGENSLILFVP